MQSITAERDYVKLSSIVPFWVKFFLCFLTHTGAGKHIPTFTYTIRKKGQRCVRDVQTLQRSLATGKGRPGTGSGMLSGPTGDRGYYTSMCTMHLQTILGG